MRIRWTTRIATAAGVLTLLAGIAAGGGPAHAVARTTAASAAATTTGHVTGLISQRTPSVLRNGNAWR